MTATRNKYKLEAVLCNPQDEKEAARRFEGLEIVLHDLVESGAFYVSSIEQINETCKKLTLNNFNRN